MIDLERVFLLWTAASPFIAIAQGFGLALIYLRFRRHMPLEHIGWVVAFIGVLWFLPLIVTRWWDGNYQTSMTGMGQLLLWMIFSASTVAGVAIGRRLQDG